MEDLAQTWTEGKILISRDDNDSKKMMIWEVGLQNGLLGKSLMGTGSFSSVGSGGGGDMSGSRKRKRVVDEDADSAAGDEEETYLDEDEDNAGNNYGSLANLSKEMREVYTILQKSTAKGRLLAEQVFVLLSFVGYVQLI